MKLTCRFAAILPLLLPTTPALAQPYVLKGINAIYPYILIDPSISTHHPALENTIRQDVELKLRAAGMAILPGYDMARPRLTISLEEVAFAFNLTVSFSEPAILQRDSTMQVQAATWVRGGSP